MNALSCGGANLKLPARSLARSFPSSPIPPGLFVLPGSDRGEDCGVGPVRLNPVFLCVPSVGKRGNFWLSWRWALAKVIEKSNNSIEKHACHLAMLCDDRSPIRICLMGSVGSRLGIVSIVLFPGPGVTVSGEREGREGGSSPLRYS